MNEPWDYPLFEHFDLEYCISLTESEMVEIIRIALVCERRRQESLATVEKAACVRCGVKLTKPSFICAGCLDVEQMEWLSKFNVALSLTNDGVEHKLSAAKGCLRTCIDAAMEGTE